MLPQPATILRMRMNPRLNGLPAYGKPYGTKMDNVLDPRDQIWFDYGRATGVTTLVRGSGCTTARSTSTVCDSSSSSADGG